MARPTNLVPLVLLTTIGCVASPHDGPGAVFDGETTSGSTNSTTAAGGDATTDESEGAGDNPGHPEAPPPIVFDFAIPDVAEPGHTCEAVDVLFVIDNSGSMADEQENLIASVPGFVSGIEARLGPGTDYHVAVVSTDDNEFNAAGCQRLGAFVVQTGGDLSSGGLCGPYADGGGFMSRRDDLAGTFDCAARLGIEGSGEERQMAAMRAALDPVAGPASCNAGFLRDEALLVLVVITDEDDTHSEGQPVDWYHDVLAAKADDDARVVVLSLVGHHKPNDCLPAQWTGMQGAEVALRLIAFTEQFEHGSVRDVCSANYDKYFEDAIGAIAQACGAAAA